MDARTWRGGLVLAAGAQLVLMAGLGPPPASADGPNVLTTVSVVPTVARGMFHDVARQPYVRLPEFEGLSATLTDAGGAPVPGAALRVERKLASEEVFADVADGVTDEVGNVFVSDPLAGDAAYRVVFDGDATRLASTSTASRVRVERDLNGDLVVRGTRRHPRPVLRGDVNPGWGGREVRFERKACATSCAFRTVATTIAGPAGHWRFRAAFPRRGHLWTYRAVLDAEGNFTSSSSVHLRTFTPPHRPGVARLRGLR